MKKTLIASIYILFLGALCSFTSFDTNKTKESMKIEQNDTSIVSVCKITDVGTTGTASNCSFYGEYDEDSNYITIYDRRTKKQVASGTVRTNRDTRGQKKNYDYCIQSTYFFNL